MAVTIINPNSTASMTADMLQMAQATVPGCAFVGRTSTKGPSAIQGRKDGAAARGPLLELVREAAAAGAAGIVIGCFDDTAMEEARASVACPVVGIGEAAFRAAANRGWRFSVVTTLPVSIPIIEENIQAYGYSGRLSRVRASGLPVLELEADPGRAGDVLLAEARTAAAEDGIEALVLGCAGMVTLVDRMRSNIDLQILDPVEEAARWIAELTAEHDPAL